MWRLTSDGLIKESSDIIWIEFDDNDRFKEQYDTIDIGRSLMLSPFDSHLTFCTTAVISFKINDNVIEFKTKQNEYKLEYENITC